MGGIRVKNLFERSMLRSLCDFGIDVWVPPNDEQYIVASTPLADNTADAAFTLNANGIGAHGNRLLWPCRLFIVVRNRAGMTSGSPGIPSANLSFASADAFSVVIVGKFMGRVVTETVVVNLITSLTTPSGQQRSHVLTTNHYDEITSISHAAKGGGWGQTTPLQVSIGLGNCEIGDPSTNRVELWRPFSAANLGLLKRLVCPWDNTSFGIGSGTSNATINNATKSLAIPGKALDFREFKAFTAQTADTLTSTGHGLTEGQIVQVSDIGDGLGGLSARTNYYVSLLSANTIALSTSRTIRNFTTSAAADTLTLNGHGIANDTPVVLYDVANGIPTGLAAATVYYVVSTAANTLQLAATVGGAAINITGGDVAIGLLQVVDIAAGGLFANNDALMVNRPFHSWRQARLIIDDAAQAEGASL